MKIVITGASGFVAQQIIPTLMDAGVTLLLVGRDPQELEAQYPSLESCGYDALAERSKGVDALLHLAVRNNDQAGDIGAFREINVELLRSVVESAKAAGVRRIIYTSTLHSEDSRAATPYGQSKAEAEAYLNAQTDLDVTILKLAAVYGTDYHGKLAVIKKVPGFLRGLAFKALASLRPTVHSSLVAEAVLGAARGDIRGTLRTTDEQKGNGVYGWTKRLIDLAFVAFVAFFLFWLLIICWALVKLTSPGPGIFAQTRVGKSGQHFTCYKFRTMHSGTKQAGTHEVTAAAVTKVGAFMRKTKIDELPQILNILKNELSLVGPRPCLPNQTELVEARTARGVYSVKPGISGWAQIQNVDMSEPVRLAKLDQEYIALQTLPLDLKIIIKTVTGSGQGDKVASR
jgi:lipopolysaccharide/colanic/teichoic acid biosynthesis glycosyltransferase